MFGSDAGKKRPVAFASVHDGHRHILPVVTMELSSDCAFLTHPPLPSGQNPISGKIPDGNLPGGYEGRSPGQSPIC